MYNKFEVVLYRFHMKKKNTLLIKGYFEEGCKKIILFENNAGSEGIKRQLMRKLIRALHYRQSLERVGQNIFMNCKWNCRETGKKDKKSE